MARGAVEICDALPRQAPIPQALVGEIFASNKFNQGFETVEYLSSAIIDMELTARCPVADVDRSSNAKRFAEMGMPKEIVSAPTACRNSGTCSAATPIRRVITLIRGPKRWMPTHWAAFTEAGGPWDRTVADKVPHDLADDRQRDRPRRRVSRLPRPRSRCEGTAQEAGLSDRIDMGDRGGKGGDFAPFV